MAYSFSEMEAKSSRDRKYAFGFPYIDSSHVKVSVDGSSLDASEYTVAGGSVLISKAISFDSGALVRVWRETPRTTALATFTSGTETNAAILNRGFLQTWYSAIEALEAQRGAIYSGSGAPSALLGNRGDFYLDTEANELYGPKETTWGTPAATLAMVMNVLFVLIDDVGVDQLSCYDDINGWDGAYPYAATPTIDSLAAGGMRFRRFFAAPICSPFRSAALRGLRAPKSTLGAVINAGATATLADAGGSNMADLAPEITTHAVGKWHLGRGNDEPSSPQTDGGFSTYAGKLENAGTTGIPGSGDVWTNFTWTTIDAAGTVVQVDETSGTKHIQIEEYNAARTLAASFDASDRWYLYWPLHYCHSPFNNGFWIAPSVLDPVTSGPYHSQGVEPGSLTVRGVYTTGLETIDTMLSGVLAQLSAEELARTVVFVVGDNGTDANLYDAGIDPSMLTLNASGNYSSDKAKATVYQGGILAPLIVWGGSLTGIQTGVSDAICEASDLYTTIAEALGRLPFVPAGTDGVSLWPVLRGEVSEVRDYHFSQRHSPNGVAPVDYESRSSAVSRPDGWKLVSIYDPLNAIGGTRDELYDLATDPFELTDRFGDVGSDATATAAYNDLLAELTRILAEAA